MTAQSRDTLKANFTLGSVIDETAMHDFIDTYKDKNNQSSINVYLSNDNITAGHRVLMLVPNRDITITYFGCLTAAISPTLSYKLRKNALGVVSDITGTSTASINLVSASSAPTVTITGASVSAGEVVFVEVISYSSTPKIGFTLRYK